MMVRGFSRPLGAALVLGLSLAVASCGKPSDKPAGATAVAADTGGLGNEADGTNWPGYGRTYGETHASPLTQISSSNVDKLGLAWSMELPDVHSGATVPLEVDGTLYFTVDQSKLHAIDVATGKEKWTYDPKVGEVAGEKLRYTWGARGIAYWNGKIYVGTTDGRLIAVDARTGQPVWATQTVRRDDVRTITGAPRAFDGLVIIGHAGADSGAVRGYVTAYDAETGQQKWRFYTVPGDPKLGFEDKAQELAAKTWTGEWWKYGGGGTVWNAMTYDPEFDTIYLGTGNGAPWNQKIRSPGGGDNLFLSSVVALDARTGKYKWHYQENPGDTWDFNSTMDMTLATLPIDGKPTKVLLHAPKNGFFYVIDRATGKLISADKFAEVNWAKSIDLKTGRPVENPEARYPNGTAMVLPASSGAHSWPPQSFNSGTGLVYIPTLKIPGLYADKTVDPKTWKYTPGGVNLGIDPYVGDVPKTIGSSALLAWDPIAKKKVWEVPTPGFWNGGTMTTLGNLVFQGHADGKLVAYDARTGKQLWSFYCGMGISGAPIAYSVNGVEYVSVVAGWGASGAGYLGSLGAQHGWVLRIHQHRVLTFKIGGTAQLPANLPPPQMVKPIDDPSIVVDPESAKRGGLNFSRTCVSCHGSGVVAAGFAPDLRASRIPLAADTFAQVVHEGILQERGMPKYGEFSDAQLADLRAYIRQRARETMGAAKAEPAK